MPVDRPSAVTGPVSTDQPTRVRRNRDSVIYLVTVSVLIFGTAWAAIHGVQGLSEPRSGPQSESGQVELAIVAPSTSTNGGAASGVSVAAYYIPGLPINGFILSFHRSLAGQKFALLLSGTATLKSPHALQQFLPETSIPCKGSAPEQCQVVFGTVPNSTEAGTTRLCTPTTGGAASDVILLDVAGKPAAPPEEPDWAHTVYSLSAVSSGSIASSSLDAWQGVSLGDSYALVAAASCTWAALGDPNQVSTYAKPTLVDQNQFIWQDASQPNWVVVKSASAGATANTFLIAASVASAVVIGLFPGALRHLRSLRASRRSAD